MPPDEEPAREEQSEAVKSCAESVMRDNPDLDKSSAFAICQDLENQGQLQEPEEPAGPDEHPTLGTPDRPPHRFLQADFSNLDAVRREEEGDDVRYKNLVLIGEGEWTDAFGNTEYYTERALQRIAENPDEFVEANHVDVNHEYEDQLLQVGHIDTNTLHAQNGLLLADVVIYGDKSAGQDIIADMDRALESEGQHGAGGFSVEIPEDGLIQRWNSERGLYELTQFKLAGGAIVTRGASGPANFDEQFAERAVALSERGEAFDIRLLSPGDTTKAAMRHSEDMSVTELNDLSEYEDADILTTTEGDPSHLLADGETVKIDIEGASVEDIREALSPDTGKEMQGEEEVAAVVDEYLASEGSPEDNVDTFLEWVRANTDADIDALEALAADYLAESEAESLSETPLSEFMAFIDGGTEEPEEPEEEEDMGEMQADIEELKELAAQVPDLKKEIEELQDRPDYGEVAGEEEDEERPVGEVLTGLATDGDYISR